MWNRLWLRLSTCRLTSLPTNFILTISGAVLMRFLDRSRVVRRVQVNHLPSTLFSPIPERQRDLREAEGKVFGYSSLFRTTNATWPPMSDFFSCENDTQIIDNQEVPYTLVISLRVSMFSPFRTACSLCTRLRKTSGRALIHWFKKFKRSNKQHLTKHCHYTKVQWEFTNHTTI